MNISNILISMLKEKKSTIYIQPHNFPDGDAIASSFGLQYFLKQYGIESIICYKGCLEKLTTQKLCDLLHIEMVEIQDLTSLKEDDYIVIVDSQKCNSNIDDFIGDEVACIDHHPTFIKYKYKYTDVRLVGACSSIIASYFVHAGLDIPKQVATALLYGIQTDTANLTRGVKDLDIDMFFKLYKLADIDIISELMITSLTVQDLKAYGTAIENMYIQNRISVVDIPFECHNVLVSKISDFMLSIDGVDFSIVYSIHDTGIKISTRSKYPKRLDAGSITAKALKNVGGGGGHPFMAGGFIPKKNVDILGKDLKKFVINSFNNCISESGEYNV